MRDASSALPMFVTWGKVCFGRNQGTGELETCMPFSLFLSIIPAKVTYIESFASKNIRVCNEIQRPLLCISLIIATVCLACFRLCRFAGRIPGSERKGKPPRQAADMSFFLTRRNGQSSSRFPHSAPDLQLLSSGTFWEEHRGKRLCLSDKLIHLQ